MVQTTYSVTADKAFAGLLGDGSDGVRDILSRASEEASAHPFGVGVTVTGATDPVTQYLLPAATGFTFLGVVAHTHALDNRALTLDNGVENGDTVDVVRKGRIWVPVEQTVTPFTSVPFLRHTANGPTDQPGFFRTDADTANADSVAANCQFIDYFAVAGDHGQVGLALLDVHLP